MNWRWVLVAALPAALVIGYGALVDRRAAPVSSSEAPPQPGYYLQDALITETHVDGSMKMRLTARRIEQQPQDGSFLLSAVHADYYQAPDREWKLSARSGFMPGDSHVLNLQGNVELWPANATEGAFLRTETMAIDTDKNIAYSTNSPVNLRFGQHVMVVNSFTADLSTEKIRVKAAKGRYEPQ
ncbi:hypothetical protein ACG33_03170 [Steroidobacter denitrificans]|uniref:Lipopolysaccharide export system protein LptC n=1 Tax=Steroidobacter denitrificans TaxID=465721 RepID=A0A127F6P2_STEDE|nr:LPS export ABC transporter periplasmic protein LptC [Steroidobacter denitrificans]AMN46126.1 hypothetical protein ACG33_03170 [Steroidobacter denitrificans]